jgi:hypothetical protein
VPATYAQLHELIDTLPDGTVFELHLVMNSAIVGNGRYVKAADAPFYLHAPGFAPSVCLQRRFFFSSIFTFCSAGTMTFSCIEASKLSTS